MTQPRKRKVEMSFMEEIQEALDWHARQKLSDGRERARVIRRVKALQDSGEAWELAQSLRWKLTMRTVCSWCGKVISGPMRPGEIKSFGICKKCVEKHF